MGLRTTGKRLTAAVVGGIFLGALTVPPSGAVAASQDAPGFGLPSDEARRLVADILDDPRFTTRQDETILNRIGRAMSEYLQRAINWFNRTVLGVGEDSAGGRFLFWTVVTLLILAVAVVVASRLANRRSAAFQTARRQSTTGDEAQSPDELERRAAEALDNLQHEEAIRLYYQAGLLRLGRRGVIEYDPSLTSGEIADVVRLAVFDHIARTFDGVAYGDRLADAAEVAAARSDWDTLLAGGQHEP